MRKTVRSMAAAATGAALIATLGAAAAPAAGARAGSGAVTDLKFGLNGVGVLSASDAWAVGDSATVLHWNGTAWAPVRIPGLPSNVSLSGVDAVSAADVWAVGQAFGPAPDAKIQTLIVHWNGTAWARVPSPGPSNQKLEPSLSHVSMDSVTDGWAVGSVFNDQSGTVTNLTLHWNGTSWQRVAASPNFVFTGVAAFSPTDVTAVGDVRAGTDKFTPAAFHWNGTSWALATKLPAPQGVPASQLGGPTDLSVVSATDMWANGVNFTGSAAQQLAWHWDGTRWTATTTPLTTPVGSGLIAVAAISAANVWAVGWTNKTNKIQPGVSAHWNGTSWTQVTTPSPGGPKKSSVLLDVGAAGPGNIWAVGYYITHGNRNTLILRWTGTAWAQS